MSEPETVVPVELCAKDKPQDPAMDHSIQRVSSPSVTSTEIVARPLLGKVPKRGLRKIRFIIFLCGDSQSGKTSLIQFLLNHIQKTTIDTERKQTLKIETKITEVLCTDTHGDEVVMEYHFVDTPGVGDTMNLWAALHELKRHLEDAAQADSMLPEGNLRDAKTTLVHACLLAVGPHSRKEVLLELAKVISPFAPVIPLFMKADSYNEAELPEFQQQFCDRLRAHGIGLFAPESHPNGFAVLGNRRHNIGGNLLDPLAPNSPFHNVALKDFLNDQSAQLMEEARRRSSVYLAALDRRSLARRAVDKLHDVTRDPRYYGPIIIALFAIVAFVLYQMTPGKVSVPAIPRVFYGTLNPST